MLHYTVIIVAKFVLVDLSLDNLISVTDSLNTKLELFKVLKGKHYTRLLLKYFCETYSMQLISLIKFRPYQSDQHIILYTYDNIILEKGLRLSTIVWAKSTGGNFNKAYI